VDEVRKAVEMVYGLMNVFEFWECEVTCFDKDANTGGLFAEYVNMYLNLKQQLSGYPFWVQNKTTRTDTLRASGAHSELF